jgi:hypothetical protein
MDIVAILSSAVLVFILCGAFLFPRSHVKNKRPLVFVRQRQNEYFLEPHPDFVKEFEDKSLISCGPYPNVKLEVSFATDKGFIPIPPRPDYTVTPTKPWPRQTASPCPQCDGVLHAIRSQNKKMCGSCEYEEAWDLKPGQKPLITNNRDTRGNA